MANTTEDKLNLLARTKLNIMNAIRSKDIEIPENTPFSDFETYIKKLQGTGITLVNSLEELERKTQMKKDDIALIYNAGAAQFYGIYQYTGTEWILLPTQLTARNDNVAPGYRAYGIEGLVEGTFTDDGTVQDNDMLYGKIAYAKGQRKVGSIEYKSTITADLSNKLGVSGVTNISDYRPDIGLAIGISSGFRGLYLYKINSDGSIGDLVNTISIDSSYFYVSYSSASAYNSGVRDAKFMINDDDLDNVYIAFASYCTFEGGGSYGHNWGFTSGALKLNKQTLSVVKTIEGKFVTHFSWNVYGGAYSGVMGIKIFPIKGNRAYITACGSSYYGEDKGVRSRLMTIDDENSSISFLSWNALSYGDYMNVLTSEDGRIVASFTDSSIKIQVFNEGFNGYSDVLSSSDFGSYKPVMLRNTMYYKQQLYNNLGEVINTYNSSPFESESSYKFYTMGYIIECLNGYAYIYQYNEINYTISFVRLVETGGMISVNRSVQDCRIMYFPVCTKYGLVLYNSNLGKYNVYIPKAAYEKVITMIRDGVYYTILDGSNATSDKLLAGYRAYSGNSLLQGTMPNRGALNIKPTQNTQTFPNGYYSEIIVNSDTFESHTEYDTCLLITNEILE